MKDKRVEDHMMNALLCFLDGDHLCVVNSDFVDIQESKGVFIYLNSSLLTEIKAKELIECNIQTRRKEDYIKSIEMYLKMVKKDEQ